MTKTTASLTRKASIEMPSGNWESFEVAFAIEDEVPSGTNRESFAAGLNSYVKVVVDAAMEVQMNDMRKKLLLPSPSAAEEFAEEVGGEVNYNAPAKGKVPEEKPPMPQEEVRTPLDEVTGEELASFKVDYFIVHGGTVKKYGASAWGEVMEALVGIDDMDVGFRFEPPYPVKAFCTTSEKGFPNKVKFFERIS